MTADMIGDVVNVWLPGHLDPRAGIVAGVVRDGEKVKRLLIFVFDPTPSGTSALCSFPAMPAEKDSTWGWSWTRRGFDPRPESPVQIPGPSSEGEVKKGPPLSPPPPPDTMNRFLVGVMGNGDEIVIADHAALRAPIDPALALNLAAWIVTLSRRKEEFLRLLAAVEEGS